VIYGMIFVLMVGLALAPMLRMLICRWRFARSVATLCRIRHYRLHRLPKKRFSQDRRQSYDYMIDTGRQLYGIALLPIYDRASTLVLFADRTLMLRRKLPVTVRRSDDTTHRSLEGGKRFFPPFRTTYKNVREGSIVPFLIPLPSCRTVLLSKETEVCEAEIGRQIYGMRLVSDRVFLKLLREPELMNRFIQAEYSENK